MQLAACIRTTDDDEPVSHAIKSILKLPEGTIKTLVLQSPSGCGSIEEQDRVKLKLAKIAVVDTSNIEREIPDNCQAVLFVPPECSFSPAGFRVLLRAVDDSRGQRITHYAMTSVTRLAGISIWYGFLVILYAIDRAWSAYDRFRHPLDRHLQLVCVTTIGSQRFLSERSWAWRIRNRGELPAITGAGAVEIRSQLEPLAQVANAIHRHPYLLHLRSSPFGNTWLALWWVAFVAISLNLLASVPLVFISSVWAVSSVLLWLIIKGELRGAGIFAMCTLWPFYLLVFPLIFFA